MSCLFYVGVAKLLLEAFFMFVTTKWCISVLPFALFVGFTYSWLPISVRQGDWSVFASLAILATMQLLKRQIKPELHRSSRLTVKMHLTSLSWHCAAGNVLQYLIWAWCKCELCSLPAHTERMHELIAAAVICRLSAGRLWKGESVCGVWTWMSSEL